MKIKFTPEMITAISELVENMAGRLDCSFPVDQVTDFSLKIPVKLIWTNAPADRPQISVFIDALRVADIVPNGLRAGGIVKQVLTAALGRLYHPYNGQEIHEIIMKQVNLQNATNGPEPVTLRVVTLPNNVRLIMGQKTMTVTKDGDVKFTLTCDNPQIIMNTNQVVLPYISDLCGGATREEREFDTALNSGIINGILYAADGNGITPFFEEDMKQFHRDPYTGQMVQRPNQSTISGMYHAPDMFDMFNNGSLNGSFNFRGNLN